MTPPFVSEHPQGTLLQVKAQPRASRNAIGEPQGGLLKIYVTAPPVDSAANDALLRLLADTLDCPRSAVQLLRGQSARQKTFLLAGLKPATVLAKLGIKA